MGFKHHPFFRNLPCPCKRKNLVTATVCQNWQVPVHKTVQPPGIFQYPSPGTQIKMIGISQDDFRMDLLNQLVTRNGFYTPCRTYRHKNRGLDLTVISMYQTCTCG